MKKLTIDGLKMMAPHKIFAQGTAKDEPNGLFISDTGCSLRWIAICGANFNEEERNG